MTISNIDTPVKVEFRIPDDLDISVCSWVCRFEYTEITVLTEHCTRAKMRNIIRKAGYDLVYELFDENKTIYGLKNPDKSFDFLEVLDFFFSLKEYTEEILREITGRISVPLSLKLIVVNSEATNYVY